MDKLIGINLLLDVAWFFVALESFIGLREKEENVTGFQFLIVWGLVMLLTAMCTTGMYLLT